MKFISASTPSALA
ncbi:hypothetical protein YPPY90_2988, partial [Yersinia pestis PY-90]